MANISPRKFLHIEVSQIPLQEITVDEIKFESMHHAIDPTTGKLYAGMYLHGCFADLSNQQINNNGRFYDIPRYLELLQLLRKNIHGNRGVYGEFEHPKSYMPNPKCASHKLIDVWYNEIDKKVYGIIVLLNRGDGLMAQEIVKSGGKLAISARAAGDEIEQPDGSKKGVVKLLTTYDIVWYPGFDAAILDIYEKQSTELIVYEEELETMNENYSEYINMNESTINFYQWYSKNLSESTQTEQEQEQQILQQKQTKQEQELQNKLENATKQNLSQDSNKSKHAGYIKQMKLAQKRLKANSVYFDGSAGFININNQ